jgi:hypothetical protein
VNYDKIYLLITDIILQRQNIMMIFGKYSSEKLLKFKKIVGHCSPPPPKKKGVGWGKIIFFIFLIETLK